MVKIVVFLLEEDGFSGLEGLRFSLLFMQCNLNMISLIIKS